MAEWIKAKCNLTWRTRICYGVGHILNDLCASMWFTYFLVYFHKVVGFSNIAAGSLLLIGQVADAVATPLVGIESDKTGECRYGRRKSWHLVGVLCVALSFPFVFNLCIDCKDASYWAQFIYYVPFIVVFQFGWASTQISHLSLIPELTDQESDKVTLNAIRYAGTVSSNIFVFLVTWILISTEGQGSERVTRSDSTAFTHIVFIVVGTGVLFMMIFHIGVNEPARSCTNSLASTKKGSKRCARNWTSWFKEVQFYQVAALYMCTRLIVNITQVYIPMYTLETLSLSKDTIAKIPLIVYVSGFLSTFLSKPLNKCYGRKGTFLIGLLLIAGTSVWMWFLGKGQLGAMYGVAILLGTGGSTLLVTALTMLADLIGENVETGAFVYGAMSFTDKLSNGITVQLIQIFHPCNGKGSTTCLQCDRYYREVMVFVTAGATVFSLVVLLTMINKRIGEFKDCVEVDVKGRDALVGDSSSVSTRVQSYDNGCTKSHCPVYEPDSLPNYGAIHTRTSDTPFSIQNESMKSGECKPKCER